MPQAKKAAAKKVASPQDFKKKARNRTELELPSGAAIIAKGLTNIRAFLKSGVIPNNLLAIIQESIDKGVEPDIDKMLQPNDDGEVSAESLDEMLQMIDNITVATWVLPPTALPPENDEDRSEDVLYTDEIMDEDKLFVMQWAIGGTDDLERFRSESNLGMDRLRASQDLEGSAK